MISLREAEVVEVIEERPGIAHVSVRAGGDSGTERAVVYPELTGTVAPGDRVLVNTIAVDLDLGSGGTHFVVCNLSSPEHRAEGPGHLCKLRYTPLQVAVLAAEEEAGPFHSSLQELPDLGGMPVVVSTVHSQLAPAVVAIKESRASARVVYVMTDGAALPLALSRTVSELRRRDLLHATVTAGNAFGGDHEAINVWSGLAVAQAARADVCVVGMGVGIAGTGTALGFSGLEQGQNVDAANTLGGRAIAVPRVSFADPRPRHRGLSHHTITALGLVAQTRARVALPVLAGRQSEDLHRALERCGLEGKHELCFVEAGRTGEWLMRHGFADIDSMGRSYEEDPAFFMAAGAAGIIAAEALGERAAPPQKG